MSSRWADKIAGIDESISMVLSLEGRRYRTDEEGLKIEGGVILRRFYNLGTLGCQGKILPRLIT